MLRMRGITKRFGSLVANDSIDLEVEPGQIHALLGENGAGKSTLMNQLYGLYRPDAGEIHFQGRQVHIHTPSTAISLGIGMVHQHPMLVPKLTVVENIVAGLPQNGWPLLSLRRHAEKLSTLAERYGFALPMNRMVGELPGGLQKQVEILKVLYRGAKLIVFDEPTDVLSPQDVETFFGYLRKLVAEGLGAIFISHHLEEVLSLADCITVLRAGKVAGSFSRGEATVDRLAQVMVGELSAVHEKRPVSPSGAPVLKVLGLRVRGEGGRQEVDGVDLEVYGGEILGIAGVAGNGQEELVEAIVGARRPFAGTVRLCGEDVHAAGIRSLIERDLLGYVPAERKRDGIAAGLTVAENLVVDRFWRPQYSKFGMLKYQEIAGFAKECVQRFNVRPPEPMAPAGTLSGGNQQKLLLARVISRQPRLVVASNPTRGLDVGACNYVHNQLLAQREKGAAVLLASSDLEELRRVSDRLAVMFRGRIMGVVRPDQVTTTEIGLMMGGQHR